MFSLDDPACQFNADEMGFQLDPKSGKILAAKGETVYSESGGLKKC